MNQLRRAGILLLLAASPPALAQGQGGGAGGADGSGATETTSGRESAVQASEGQPGSAEKPAQRREGRTPGVGSTGVHHRRSTEVDTHRPSDTGGSAPVVDAPTTTGGGR
jgi:hypothetical protein